MTQPPNYATKTYSTRVTSGTAAPTQPPGLSAEKQRQFNQWNQNVAMKPDLTGGDVPVAGQGVNGVAREGYLQATSVVVDTTNMLVSQNFSSPDTMVPFKHWSYDGTDGNLTLGCAKVDCDGTQDDLISNEIPVIEGETIQVSVQTKCEGISYTGIDPIVMGVQKYRQGRDPVTNAITWLDVGGIDVVALDTPAADVNWGEGDLSGTYVVEAGVDQLRFRFSAPGVTGGIVKWDEAVFLKIDLIDDVAVPGVGTTVDDIVRELFGTDGEAYTHNDSAVALGNASAAIKSLNSRLSQLEAAASAGAIAGDEFSYTGEIITTGDWGGAYSQALGYYAAANGDAVWNGAPNGFDASVLARFIWEGTDSVSDTDYQVIQVLLSSPPQTDGAGFTSYVHLLGRVSTGFGSYVRASFGSDGTWVVDHWNGSAFTVLASGTCPVPGAGSLLTLKCGEKSSTTPRKFTLSVNNVPVPGGTFTEVGTASPLGASNRRWGWGSFCNGGLYFFFFIIPAQGQGIPPRINQWLAYDQ